MKLIDKSVVMTKIDERRDKIKKGIFSIPLTGKDRAYATFEYEILGKIKDFLDTLEVKEVDLEKELDEWMKYGPHTNYPWCTVPDAIKITAKHFYESGLNANKGE